jgi:hypothetical protein
MVVTPRFAPVVEQLTHVLVPGSAFSLSGLIASRQWMQANYGKVLRKYLSENTTYKTEHKISTLPYPQLKSSNS